MHELTGNWIWMQDNLQPTTVIYYDSRVKEKMCYVEIMFPFLSFFFLFFVQQGNIYGERPNSQWIRELLWWCNADLWPDFICHFYDYKHPELAAAKSVGEVVILKISFNLCRSFTAFWWFFFLYVKLKNCCISSEILVQLLKHTPSALTSHFVPLL